MTVSAGTIFAMRKFYTLLSREVSSYFYSPIAYIVLVFFLVRERSRLLFPDLVHEPAASAIFGAGSIF